MKRLLGSVPSIVIYLGVSIVCTQIPLFDYLGYEFSFVVALTGSLIAGLTSAGTFLRSLPARGVVGIIAGKRLFVETLLRNLAMAGIPVVVMIVNALFVKNCSMLEGVAFFFLLPVISICFSVCLAFFCAAHYRHPGIIFVALLTLSLGYVIALGYFTPAIYSYNFFYGYFPGLTYDEILEITSSLILFRAVTLLLGYFFYRAALVILGAGPVERRTLKKGEDLIRGLFRGENRKLTVSACVLVTALIFFRAELGLESPVSFIRGALGSSIKTPHFDIYYADSVYTAEEAAWLAAEHEFSLMQIGHTLGQPFEGRIGSYVYPDVDTKRRFIGAGTTSIAKPWSGQIHIHAGGVHDALKHELIHLAVAPYGAPIVRASISPGLTEGFAMAVEWNWGNRTPHEYAAGMKQAGIAPDMELIMGSVGLLRQASSVSYVLAGSFCRFLIDRYGIPAVKEVYAWGDYESVFGKKLHVLLKEWEEMLASVETDEGIRDVVDAYFRAAPIFGKTCARVTARRVKEARRAFNERSYDRASSLYGEAYAGSRSNEALGGLLVSELRLGRTERLISLGDSLGHAASPGRLMPLLLPIGDAFWLEGRTAESNQQYARLIRANLSRASTEAALVRRLATGDSLASLFRTYFLSDLHDSLRVAILDSVLALKPGNSLSLYLRGKALLRLGRYEDALIDFDQSGGAALDSELEAGRRLGRGDALFRLRRFREARESYLGSLSAGPSAGLEQEVKDMVQRCDWYEANGMPDALLQGRGMDR